MSLAKDLSIDPTSRGKLFFYQVYEMEFVRIFSKNIPVS